jgi:small subunit ribosomal protein S3
MTHVAHPYAQRIGILRDWRNRWFAADEKKYKEFLRCDTVIRDFLKKRLKGMYVSGIEIERSQTSLRIIIQTSRPGIIIGRQGEGAAKLKKEIMRRIGKLNLTEKPELKIDVEEVRSPESNAAIVAEMVVEGLEKRMPFRRVLKQTIEKVMANRDVQGVRIGIAGRLGGAEMSRKEEIKRGRIPLQTLRADVEFKRAEAYMPYTGLIGVKVWIYKGDIFE